MELLLTPLVLVALILYVAWPLLREKAEDYVLDDPTEHDLAFEEKENAIASLKDIEMDFRMGKLSEEDYERLKSEWEVRAVDALKKLEVLERRKPVAGKQS